MPTKKVKSPSKARHTPPRHKKTARTPNPKLRKRTITTKRKRPLRNEPEKEFTVIPAAIATCEVIETEVYEQPALVIETEAEEFGT